MKKFLMTFGLTIVLIGGGLALPSMSYAQNAQQDICQGVTANSGSNSTCTVSGPSVSDIINDVANLLSAVVGIAAVIMIVISGFRYVTAGGDPGKISGAKDALIYALVGLVIAAFAQFLVKFVLNKVGIGT